MDVFLCLCVLFAFGSSMGWVLELLFRRFISSKKWINPGFLVGPCLPIYGIGVTMLFVISYVIKTDEWFSVPPFVNTIIVIVIMTIVMTLIELIGGIIFIKGMGLKLWDYTDRWGNYKGIICPLFSLIWGLAGAGFYFFLQTPCLKLIEWFATHTVNNAYFPFVLGMFYGVFIVDICYSFKVGSKISKFAKEHQIVVRYEQFKEQIRAKQEEAKERISFILPFKSTIDLKDHLQNYLEKYEQLKEKLIEKIEKIKKD